MYAIRSYYARQPYLDRLLGIEITRNLGLRLEELLLQSGRESRLGYIDDQARDLA